MIRHVAIIHFKKDPKRDYDALLEKTKPLILQIPGILEYKIFKNESQYTPQGVYSLGVEILFEDGNALQRFMDHPKHAEANQLFTPYLADPPYMVLTHEVI